MDVGYYIDTLRDALPAGWRDFLVALLAAINDPAARPTSTDSPFGATLPPCRWRRPGWSMIRRGKPRRRRLHSGC
jgi:hypothetical protein